MKRLIVFCLLLCGLSTWAQVGINTDTPKGTLDVVSSNNTGMIWPRVDSIEDVTDGNGGLPINGTAVYDISRGATCFYQNDDWVCIIRDSNGAPVLIDVVTSPSPVSPSPLKKKDEIKFPNK